MRDTDFHLSRNMLGLRVISACVFLTFLSIACAAVRRPASDLAKNLTDGCQSPGVWSLLTPCYCDAACEFYNDCCHRFHKVQRLFRCLDLEKLKVKTERPSWAFVFDRCPPGTNAELKRRCEQAQTTSTRKIEEIVKSAVIASDDKRLFRNVYCALCHKAKIMAPNLKLVCNENQSGNDTTDSESINAEDVHKVSPDCQMENRISSFRYRSCEETRNEPAVLQCPERQLPSDRFENSSQPFLANNESMTWSEVQVRCSTKPTYYVRCVNDSRLFRNSYCAACHLPSGHCVEKRSAFAPIGLRRNVLFSPPMRRPLYSYSIIIDFKRLAEEDLQQPQPELISGNVSSFENETFGNSSQFENITEPSASPWRQVSSYLTLTCCLLSALGLVLLIVVFAVVPPLRNFGGVLTLALASSLLVGLLCFLIGPIIEQFPLLCRIVGVVMYFAYLSSFAWMSLFAFDVFRTFATSARASGISRSSSIYRRLAKFSVGGWLLPLIVTLAAVTVDVVWPQSAVSARFGRGQCYFNNGYALLGWFFVPVAVAVGANVVISVIVITSVWRTAKQAKRARGDSTNKQLIFLSLKITAIFGLTWAFGIVSALVENMYFTEIAGLVNSLQGAFVSLSFLLSSRTIKEVRSLSTSFTNSTSATSSTKYTAVKSKSESA